MTTRSEIHLAPHLSGMLFPSENAEGVPTLDLQYQAQYVRTPVLVWGSLKRNQRLGEGTYLFYTADYRFTALAKDAMPLIQSECRAIVEPNFSTSEQCSRYEALYAIGEKRRIARYCQTFGMEVWVDLNVAPEWYALNLLGVPFGWRSYATRGYSDRLEYTCREHAMAVERAQTDDIRFMVYGGGQAVRELCRARGFIHVPETMDVRRSKA